MRFIAHRANLYGSNKLTENKPETINTAISLGFDCEVDVWFLNGTFWLGHDCPETMIDREFLETHKKWLWVHCKHLEALVVLKDDFNCFYHDKDVYTLTSKGNIWGNIGSPMNPLAIQVMPERAGVFSFNCAGICTDLPVHYKDIYMRTLNQ